MSDITNNGAEANLALVSEERDRNTAEIGTVGDRKPANFQVLVRADFSDIDHLCQVVSDWNLDFRPVGRPADVPRLAHLVQASADQVHYGYARCSLNLDQRGAPPSGCVTFGVLEETVQRLWWRGRDIDNATVLVFPFGGELHSLSGSDFGVHTVSVEIALIEEICAQLDLQSSPGFGPFETFKPDANCLRFLRSELARLVLSPEGRMPVAARRIAETLVQAWGEASGMTRDQGRTIGHTRTMRKALERIDAPDWLSLTPTELHQYAGVSERTLQNAFRDRFGMSPAAYLKARRLAAVRAALKSGDAGPGIGDVAAEFGFWHTGQFAADYRRIYGELPSKTLGRSRNRTVHR